VAEICRQRAGVDARPDPSGAGWVVDQLVCDGKTLRGSIVQTDGGGGAFISSVTALLQDLGVGQLPRPILPYTREISRACPYWELLPRWISTGPLIPGRRRYHTQKPVFSAAHEQGRTSSPAVEKQTKGPASPDRRGSSFYSRKISSQAMVLNAAMGRRTHLDTQAKQAPDFHQRGLARRKLGC